jgi:carboxylate-amine ligase
VRPQPKFGTVEIRIMDAQSTLDATAALVALVQSLARLELVEGHADAALVHAPEVLDENRFLAARDGVEAELVDPVRGHAVPVAEIAGELVLACAPHAQKLDCNAELARVAALFAEPGAAHQRRLAAEDGLDSLVERLAADFGRDRTRDTL